MSSDILIEELEVLESIYPTELTKISERDVSIEVEPDDVRDGSDIIKLTLSVHYPNAYPEVVPELSLDVIEGSLDDDERFSLLEDLKTVGGENSGMAMTFSLVSHLRERLSGVVSERQARRKKEEMETERLALEEEEAKTRGTPVTVESFKVWRANFDRDTASMKTREEEERLKGMSPKEREEWKRILSRLTGRQLFERDKVMEEDEPVEDGTVSVDFSQYEREKEIEEDEHEYEEHVTFSDSD